MDNPTEFLAHDQRDFNFGRLARSNLFRSDDNDTTTGFAVDKVKDLDLARCGIREAIAMNYLPAGLADDSPEGEATILIRDQSLRRVGLLNMRHGRHWTRVAATEK